MDDLKDSRAKVIVVGILIPMGLAGLALWNAVTGWVYWLADKYRGDMWGGFIFSFDDPWRVWGTVSFKLGLAGGLFSWFALANFESTERWAQLYLLISIIAAMCGFLAAVVGFFI